MSKVFALAACAALLIGPTRIFGQAKPRQIPTGPGSVIESKPNTLFSGWKLTPAGRHVGVNSLPLKMAVSADGFRELAQRCAALAPRVAAVLEGGYNLETLSGLVEAALEGFENRS